MNVTSKDLTPEVTPEATRFDTGGNLKRKRGLVETVVETRSGGNGVWKRKRALI